MLQKVPGPEISNRCSLGAYSMFLRALIFNTVLYKPNICRNVSLLPVRLTAFKGRNQ